MKYYRMKRIADITGNSGIGYIAEVVVGGPGTAIVLWSEDSNALGVSSIVVYASLEDCEKVHGHGGSTVLEAAELTPERREQIINRLRITQRKIQEVAWVSTAIRPSSSFA
jgi:hypothetical protein